MDCGLYIFSTIFRHVFFFFIIRTSICVVGERTHRLIPDKVLTGNTNYVTFFQWVWGRGRVLLHSLMYIRYFWRFSSPGCRFSLRAAGVFWHPVPCNCWSYPLSPLPSQANFTSQSLLLFTDTWLSCIAQCSNTLLLLFNNPNCLKLSSPVCYFSLCLHFLQTCCISAKFLSFTASERCSYSKQELKQSIYRKHENRQSTGAEGSGCDVSQGHLKSDGHKAHPYLKKNVRFFLYTLILWCHLSLTCSITVGNLTFALACQFK